jgi:hypothetical protein
MHYFFNSILSGSYNVAEGTEKRELIEKLVDKIIVCLDGADYLIYIHFQQHIEAIKI